MKFIIILLLIALIFALPIVLLYKNKALINVRGLLLGILLYFVFRILIYPVISLSTGNLSIIFKSIIDVILLSIYTLIIKKFILVKFLHYTKENKAELFSIGIGESILEMIFVFVPTLLNTGMYAYLIEFGNIYLTLENSFTIEQINSFVTTINAIGFDYYAYLAFVITTIYLFNITNNYLLIYGYKYSISITLFFYTIYFLIAILNYWFACLCLMVLIICIYRINMIVKE